MRAKRASKPRSRYVKYNQGGKTSARRVFRPLSSVNKKGYLELWRRAPEVSITNSVTENVAAVNNSNSILSVGTPISTIMGTYDIPFSMTFKLSDIINYTDLTNLADQYKIKFIVVKIYFNSNTNTVGSQNSLPQISYVVDHDDAVAPPSTNALREKSDAKIKYFTSDKNYVKIMLQPRVAQSLFNTGVVVPTAYGVGTKPMWINSAYPNAEHYALKAVLQNVMLPATGAGPRVGFKFDINYHIAAKDFQ